MRPTVCRGQHSGPRISTLAFFAFRFSDGVGASCRLPRLRGFVANLGKGTCTNIPVTMAMPSVLACQSRSGETEGLSTRLHPESLEGFLINIKRDAGESREPNGVQLGLVSFLFSSFLLFFGSYYFLFFNLFQSFRHLHRLY